MQGLPKFFGYPLLSQERVKLRTSNFVGTFIALIGTKSHENVGNSGRGRSQGVPKIFRAPICRAHCAVIFSIAQLSCFTVSVAEKVAILQSSMYYRHNNSYRAKHSVVRHCQGKLFVCNVEVS